MNSLRIPPYNLEAERAILAAILIDSEIMNKVGELLRPDYFYDQRNQIIFEHVSKLYLKGKNVDLITLNASLSKSNQIKQAGGQEYLSEIIVQIPTSANAEDYADLVRESAIRRKLIEYGAQLDQDARKQDVELNDILNDLEKNLFSISKDSTTSDFYDAATLLELQMKKADEYAKNPSGLRGLPTGLNSLDGILGGLHRSDLIIVAARPSVGKSAFSFDIARHIAVEEGKTVAIFSLEMPAIQVIERMLAQQIKVNLWNLRMSKLTDEDYRKYSIGAGKIGDSKLFIDDTPGINIMQLRTKTRKLMLEHNLDLILIDYLQLMQGNSRGSDNRAQEIAEISRSLKILARELNVPIIALSQLNRAVENRQEKIPQLSDLRESGSIEQDADLVVFLGREVTEEVVDEANPVFNVDVFIAKHRNGPTGKIRLKFVGAQQKFFDETK